MKPIKGPYFELARFVRDFLEAREMDVPQAAMLLWPIKESRIYDWTSGRRTMDGWEVSHFYKRTGLIVPARHLRGEDKYGRVQNNREPNQVKMEALLKQAGGDRRWLR